MIRGVFGRERWFVSELLKTLVVLGARGDMTGRLLLPALVQLAGSGELPESLQVLAVDRDASDDDAYRDHARGKLDAHLPDRDDKAADALLERLSYRQADVTSADDLRAALEKAATPMAVYLALPNVLFRPTLQALADAGLPRGTTVVVEKPFGADLADAKALNELIAQSFNQHHVFRIDHFLAKQTILDILGFRFADRIFDPVWKATTRPGGHHLVRVAGLGGPPSCCDRAGALRDMIQNHLLQMLTLIVEATVRIGFERTPEQDPGLGIRQMIDPACKALSPAVNDPYTAIQAIEHLGVLLAALAARPVGPQAHPGRDRRAPARARSLWLAPAGSLP